MFRKRFFMPNPMMQVSKSENQRFSSSGALKSQNMQISLKLIRGLNHVKLTIHTKFQSLVIFNSPVTGSSILPVFALSVLQLNSFRSCELKNTTLANINTDVNSDFKSCVHKLTTSKRIKLGSPCWSGFEALQIFFQT